MWPPPSSTATRSAPFSRTAARRPLNLSSSTMARIIHDRAAGFARPGVVRTAASVTPLPDSACVVWSDHVFSSSAAHRLFRVFRTVELLRRSGSGAFQPTQVRAAARAWTFRGAHFAAAFVRAKRRPPAEGGLPPLSRRLYCPGSRPIRGIAPWTTRFEWRIGRAGIRLKCADWSIGSASIHQKETPLWKLEAGSWKLNPMPHKYPALHNAMWPGLVGKGPDSEPPIDLDTMLDMTGRHAVDGVKFDGVDLFLSDPHTSIDASDDDLKRLADGVGRRGLVVGSLVAPVWPPTGGGSAMGDEADRQKFLAQVEKACGIGRTLRDLGIRNYGVIRIDSSASPGEWAKDPAGNTRTDRRDLPSGRRHRRGPWRAARGRRGDLLGRHAQLEADGRAARSGRPAARPSACRPTWRTPCCSCSAPTRPRIASCQPTTTGPTPTMLDEALRTHDTRAASLDDRLPCRPERRDGEGLRLARQDRPALPAARPERQARHRQARRLLAARRRRRA